MTKHRAHSLYAVVYGAGMLRFWFIERPASYATTSVWLSSSSRALNSLKKLANACCFPQ